jgi:hypothetical protein
MTLNHVTLPALEVPKYQQRQMTTCHSRENGNPGECVVAPTLTLRQAVAESLGISAARQAKKANPRNNIVTT